MARLCFLLLDTLNANIIHISSNTYIGWCLVYWACFHDVTRFIRVKGSVTKVYHIVVLRRVRVCFYFCRPMWRGRPSINTYSGCSGYFRLCNLYCIMNISPLKIRLKVVLLDLGLDRRWCVDCPALFNLIYLFIFDRQDIILHKILKIFNKSY